MNAKYTLYECLANADMTQFKMIGKIAYRILQSDLDFAYGNQYQIMPHIFDEYKKELQKVQNSVERHELNKRFIEKVNRKRSNAKQRLDRYFANGSCAYVIEYVNVDTGSGNRSIPTDGNACVVNISGRRRDIKNGAVSNFDIKMINQKIQITR